MKSQIYAYNCTFSGNRNSEFEAPIIIMEDWKQHGLKIGHNEAKNIHYSDQNDYTFGPIRHSAKELRNNKYPYFELDYNINKFLPEIINTSTFPNI